jgi:hypothetical protein
MKGLLLLLLAFAVGTLGLIASERVALLAFHGACGGPSWFVPWNLTSPSPCTWFGVTCDPTQESVVELTLPSNNLVGTLPDLQLPELLNM